jgi:rare lipoprotein A
MNRSGFLLHSVFALFGALLFSNCATTVTSSPPPVVASGPKVVAVERGEASWYSVKTNGGTQTASGKRLQDDEPTAAHKTLPLGTKVRVTNLDNGLQEVVTITDRGPYIRGRTIDLTIGAAGRLDFVRRGVVPVKVEVLAEDEELTGLES